MEKEEQEKEKQREMEERDKEKQREMEERTEIEKEKLHFELKMKELVLQGRSKPIFLLLDSS